MAIITITSDCGTEDHYPAAVKGKILSQLPDAVIVDVTYQIPPFNIGRAAYILRNVFPYYPENTIHIIGVNAIASMQCPHVVVHAHGQYFIGADNGIFSLLFDELPTEVYEIDLHQDSDYFTFPVRDLFSKVACEIAKNTPLEQIGSKTHIANRIERLKPVHKLERDENGIPVAAEIRANIVYIDHYGNVITNLHQNLFEEYGRQFQSYSIKFRGKDQIAKLSRAYQDVSKGNPLAIFDSNGYLQLATNYGNFSKLEGMDTRDTVLIKFTQPK